MEPYGNIGGRGYLGGVYTLNYIPRPDPGFLGRRALHYRMHQHAIAHTKILCKLSLNRFRFHSQHRAAQPHEHSWDIRRAESETVGKAGERRVLADLDR